MKKIVVIGGGGHAKVLISILKKNAEYEVIGYTDPEDKGALLGIPYLGKDEIIPSVMVNANVQFAAMGVGSVNVNGYREKVYSTIKSFGLEFPAIVSKDAIVNEDVQLGEGTVVYDGVVVNSGTRIGIGAIINTNSTVEHDCVIGDFTHVAPGSTLCGEVHIGRNCMIGAGSTVIQSITIPANSLVRAGSVVVKNPTK
ncbi:MAG: NeuD/PglB/VioB family sugar acetyltransferase [Bacteroidales bacterium]